MNSKFRVFFDTETTGMILKGVPLSDPGQPKLLQFGAMLDNPLGETIAQTSFYVAPYWEGEVPAGAVAIHGITKKKCKTEGLGTCQAADMIKSMLNAGESPRGIIIAHNISYDKTVIEKFFGDLYFYSCAPKINGFCTMLSTTKFCAIPGAYGLKWPKLQELYRKLFDENFEEAHDALVDVKATRKCYYELIKRGVIEE